MSIGLLTSFLGGPKQQSENAHSHTNKEYLTFFCLFLVIVTFFIFSFYNLGTPLLILKANLKETISNKALVSFIVGSLRLVSSIFLTVAFGYQLETKIVNTEMIESSYIAQLETF